MKSSSFTMQVNDTDISWYGMKLVSYEIQSHAKRKTLGIDIPGAHGTQEVPSALASAGFKATLVCTGRDPEHVNTQVREFFAFLYSTTQLKIVFSDDESVVRYAVLDSPENYRVINGVDGAFTQFMLNFVMLDPFMHDSDKSFLVADAAHGEKLTIYNPAFECPAVYSIENTSTKTVTGVGIIVNGELARFSCELNPGDIIKLDTEEFEVSLNEILRLEYWEGEMPLLKHGLNEIVQQNTEKSNLRLSVAFTKLWV